MQPTSDDPRRWRLAFGLLLFATAITKLWLAARLPLFVDEAFYWQESRHLAWTYSDLPALTAWLIHAGEVLFGHSELAVRSLFLAMALAIPLAVRRLATRHGGERAGWQAACWTLALPLLASFGVLALPDVPLTLFCVLAVDLLDRLADRPRSLHLAGLLGVVLALAWLSHYRAAILWLAGLAFLLATARGRRMGANRGIWIAVAIGLCGLLPALMGDAPIGGDALRFQLLERHPWAFHADALLQPLEQVLVTTPLLWALLVATGIAGWRRLRRPPAAPGPLLDVLLCVAATFVLGYFLLGLYADAQRFRVHWPLPGWLLLIVALPPMLRHWTAVRPGMRWLTGLAAAMAALATLAVHGYFAVASTPGGAGFLSRYKAFPEHFVGWNEAAATTRQLLERPGSADAILVADNFMLAAELDFAGDGARPVYSLDHSLNAKHGRAPQLRLWQRDEAGLSAQRGRTVLLVVDESAGRERDRPAWLSSLCGRIAGLSPLERLDLYDGRKRFAWYLGRVPDAARAGAGDCVHPPPE